MLRRNLIMTFLLAGASFICSLVYPLRAKSDDTRLMKIGVLTDLSGSAAYFGQQSRIGAEIAKEELLKNGARVEVILEDSGMNTQKALSAANKLLLLDKVDAIYVNFTPIARAVAPLLAREKKLMIYSAGAASIVNEGPYIFKTYLDEVKGCKQIAESFKNRGVKKIGMLKVEMEAAELCLQGARMGTEDLQELSFNMLDPVNSQVLVLKDRGAQAIINASYEGDIINMLKAMHQIGFKAFIGGDNSSFTPDLLKDFKEDLEGSLTYGHKIPPPQVLRRAQELDANKRLHSYDMAGLAWLHIKQLYEAVKACPTGDVECAAKKLGESPPEPAIGFAGFKDRVAQLEIVIKIIKGGKLVEL